MGDHDRASRPFADCSGDELHAACLGDPADGELRGLRDWLFPGGDGYRHDRRAGALAAHACTGDGSCPVRRVPVGEHHDRAVDAAGRDVCLHRFGHCGDKVARGVPQDGTVHLPDSHHAVVDNIHSGYLVVVTDGDIRVRSIRR